MPYRFLFSVVLFLRLGSTIANNDYPQNYFFSPVKHEIQLTGTFGELRPNHFHAGIDIRPRQSGVAEPILASAEGWISRIQVQSSGYGNVLFVDHPNGFTTVYAHLQNFTPEIDSIVKFSQYQQEKFEVNLLMLSAQIKIIKAQTIGIMGNTGASQGMHLHFEIRRTGSDEALNPLLFGFEISDEKAPKFYELKIYNLDDESKTVSSREIYLREKAKKKRVKKGKKWKTITIAPDPDAPYVIQNDTLDISSGRVAFGIKAYDSHNWSNNSNGIFGLEMYQDGLPVYSFDTECFYFDDTRYINAHIDYSEKQNGGGYFNRCFCLPGNNLSIYKDRINNGVLNLRKGQRSNILLVAKDAAENRDTLEFWVRCLDNSIPKKSNRNYFKHLCFDENNHFSYGNLRAEIPAGALYESTDINVGETESRATLAFSPMYRIHNSEIPLHKSMTISIRPSRFIADSLLNKVCVAYKAGDGSLINCGKEWVHGDLTAVATSFGSFFIFADTVKPTIKPMRFQQKMEKENRMSFKVSDNMSLDKFLNWRAEVDGKWILMSFDFKSRMLTHYFDGRITSGEHTLKLSVSDKQGNEQILQASFIR